MRNLIWAWHLAIYSTLRMWVCLTSSSNLCQLLISEAWQLYGDGIWWTICYSSDGNIFNILWPYIQWVLLGSIPYIWQICLWVPGKKLQVCLLQVLMGQLFSGVSKMLGKSPKLYYLLIKSRSGLASLLSDFVVEKSILVKNYCESIPI